MMRSIFDNPLPPDRIFIVQPKNIGTITHAYSDLQSLTPKFSKQNRTYIRIAALFIPAAVGYVIALLIGCGMIGTIAWPTGFAIAGFIIAFEMTPAAFYNAFVGTEGFVIYKIDSATMETTVDKELLFSQADWLLRKTLDKFSRGAYTNTTWEFRWINKNGEMLLEETGIYNKDISNASVENSKTFLNDALFWFYFRAEEAWLDYFMKKNYGNISMNEFSEIEFPVFEGKNFKHVDNIYLSGNQLRIDGKHTPQSVTKEDIGNIKFDEGFLIIKSRDYDPGFIKHKGTYIARRSEEVANVMLLVNTTKKYFDFYNC